MLIRAGSVSKTVDAVGALIFERKTASLAERTRTAKWLAARQGLPGAYAEMFAGFDAERKQGLVVFTGERFTSASALHILGEETSRALRLLKVKDRAVRSALSKADASILECLARPPRDPRKADPGRYCCGKCTVGLWRNLLSGGLDRQEERLKSGVRFLKSLRDGKGEWRGMPFWYTALALEEMDFADAKRELAYAAPGFKAAVARKTTSTTYALRRRTLAERALERI
jgi:hypothetical protein